MFSIASQTVTLRHPKAEETSLLVFTGIQGHDTSRCILELGEPDGNKIRLVFNRAGMLISQDWIERPDGNDDARTFDDHDNPWSRSRDPYTHVAPVTHGDPVLTGVGGLQPDVFNADGSPAVTPQMREHALEEAAARARGDRDEQEGDDHEELEQEGDDHEELEHEEALGEQTPPEPAFATPASPGPNPFEEAPPVRNRMTPQDPVHGRVNTTESLRNG